MDDVTTDQTPAAETPETPAVPRPAVTLKGVPGGEPYPDAPLSTVIEADGFVRVKLRGEYWPPSSNDYNYRLWPGVLWTLEFADVATAKAFREDMEGYVRGWVETRTGGAR